VLIPPRPILMPLSLGFGLVLAAYGVHLRRRFVAVPVPVGSTQAELARRTALGFVVVLSAFWAIGDYGGEQGNTVAERVAADLREHGRGVVVYSLDRLYLTGDGVHVDRLDDTDAAYRFRYEGLRLLTDTSDSYILLPKGWTRRSGAPAFVVPKGAGIRADFQALP
jgi:hypothetical protein